MPQRGMANTNPTPLQAGEATASGTSGGPLAPLNPIALWLAQAPTGGGWRLAAALGVSGTTITQWKRGQREPTFAQLAEIEVATGGVITAEVWAAWRRAAK